MATTVRVLVTSLPAAASLWAQLASPLRAGLEAAGRQEAQLFVGLWDGEAEEAAEVFSDYCLTAEDVPVLCQFWEVLEPIASRELRAIAITPTPLAVATSMIDSRKRLRSAPSVAVDLPPADLPMLAMPGRWPIKLARNTELRGDPQARAKKEAAMRRKWVSELRDLVISAHLPLASMAATSQDPESLMQLVGAGRRSATIRRRVLDWKPAARYFMLVSGRAWPSSAPMSLGYLGTLHAAGRGHSAITRAAHAFT